MPLPLPTSPKPLPTRLPAPTTLPTTRPSKPFRAGAEPARMQSGQGVQAIGLHALPFFCRFRERAARLASLSCDLNMGESAMNKLAFLLTGAAALALAACNNTDADDADDAAD